MLVLPGVAIGDLSRLLTPDTANQVNLKLAQDLVDRFVPAGAEKVFVGPSLGLTGPSDVVVPLINHDNHLHARLPLDSWTTRHKARTLPTGPARVVLYGESRI